MEFEVKITQDGDWELHKAGCQDVGKGAQWWVASQSDNPAEALAVEIMGNYCFKLGVTNPETGLTLNTYNEVIKNYGARIMACCAHRANRG